MRQTKERRRFKDISIDMLLHNTWEISAKSIALHGGLSLTYATFISEYEKHYYIRNLSLKKN